jgi:hypothetical protein
MRCPYFNTFRANDASFDKELWLSLMEWLFSTFEESIGAHLLQFPLVPYQTTTKNPKAAEKQPAEKLSDKQQDRLESKNSAGTT